MHTAYLLAALDTTVFPPYVKEVKITSQAAGSMTFTGNGTLWVEIMHVKTDSFQESSDQINNFLASYQKMMGDQSNSFQFIAEYRLNDSSPSYERKKRFDHRLKAVASAIQMVTHLFGG